MGIFVLFFICCSARRKQGGLKGFLSDYINYIWANTTPNQTIWKVFPLIKADR